MFCSSQWLSTALLVSTAAIITFACSSSGEYVDVAIDAIAKVVFLAGRWSGACCRKAAVARATQPCNSARSNGSGHAPSL